MKLERLLCVICDVVIAMIFFRHELSVSGFFRMMLEMMMLAYIVSGQIQIHYATVFLAVLSDACKYGLLFLLSYKKFLSVENCTL